MAKLELLAVLYSLDKLHEVAKPDEAHAVIKKLIEEAESERNKGGK